MANLMSLNKLRNNPSLSGFDLSKRRGYTQNAGELLPLKVWEIIPGDTVEIEVSALTRTAPIQTAAMTRIKDYYDFIFVPSQLLWNKYPNFVTQMGNNSQTAGSLTNYAKVGENLPYFTLFQLLKYYGARRRGDQTDMMGVKFSHNMRKLLWYLGYGDLEWYFENGYDDLATDDVNLKKFDNYNLNPFPLLAYHKAYSDYYRFSQWEESNPTTFNVNYMTGDAMQLPINALGNSNHPMFLFHYSNWNKDLFMGLLPQSQFGNTASIVLGDSNATVGLLQAELLTNAAQDQYYGTQNYVRVGPNNYENLKQFSNRLVVYNNNDTTPIPDSQYWTLTQGTMNRLAFALGLTKDWLPDSVSDPAKLIQHQFSILDLRKKEAEQKFREITQSVHQDYQSQVKAHWDVNVSDAYSERSIFIGGTDSLVDISEVVNNNLTDDNTATIQGKGIGVQNGKISFNSQVHGFLVCIAHKQPQLDYAFRSGVHKLMTKTNVADFAIPEFDRIGMDSVPRYELFNDKTISTDSLLGYAPRYYDYKTDVDDVVGGFVVGGLNDWVAPLSEEYLRNYLKDNNWSFQIMKVNPNILNSIFTFDVGKTDFMQEQFRCLVNFNAKFVRKLDRDGLPY